MHQQPVSLMFASKALSDAELQRVNEAIAALPALEPAFAPPRCRFDNTRFPHAKAPADA
ncbi:hypothetical protein D3C80_2150080 [compost metagenome]